MSVDRQLLVVGAGTMGAQIAQQAALHAVDVTLVDVGEQQLRRAVDGNRTQLERRVQRGKLDEGDARDALARVATSTDLAAAARNADWVIEAIVEAEEPKRALFAELDRLLPEHAGMATNSSNIVVSRLADATNRPDRCCNMHFFHPVLVMNVCEIVRGPQTSDATMERAIAWSRRMERTPVVVEREIDGFIVNRVLGAASREAFMLLAEGIATVEDIDIATRAGLNWPMGPFQLADFSGLDTVLGVRRDRMLREHEPGDEATVAILERLVAEGRLGRKSGRGFYDYSTDPPRPLPLPG